LETKSAICVQKCKKNPEYVVHSYKQGVFKNKAQALNILWLLDDRNYNNLCKWLWNVMESLELEISV